MEGTELQINLDTDLNETKIRKIKIKTSSGNLFVISQPVDQVILEGRCHPEKEKLAPCFPVSYTLAINETVR